MFERVEAAGACCQPRPRSKKTPWMCAPLLTCVPCLHMQGSLPIVLAALAFNPAPLLLYAFVFVRVAENTLNHSGLADCWLLDVLSLKCLPLRAPVSFHDSHHKYCNHGGGASNFAESFIVWDWLLGTLAPASLAGVSAAKVAAAAVKKA